jgi:hypothetical protein
MGNSSDREAEGVAPDEELHAVDVEAEDCSSRSSCLKQKGETEELKASFATLTLQGGSLKPKVGCLVEAAVCSSRIEDEWGTALRWKLVAPRSSSCIDDEGCSSCSSSIGSRRAEGIVRDADSLWWHVEVAGRSSNPEAEGVAPVAPALEAEELKASFATPTLFGGMLKLQGVAPILKQEV